MRKCCETCKHDDTEYLQYPWKTPCDECMNTNDAPTKWEAAEHYKPDTNADRIRAMSDEELMQFLFNEVSNNTICSFCVPTMRTKCKCDGHCKNGILEWLKQPAEE